MGSLKFNVGQENSATAATVSEVTASRRSLTLWQLAKLAALTYLASLLAKTY